jgi:exopolyphosphatase/guanosine-5'-triphosphate,3'-diphosphate pyrophosphatase
MAQYNHIGFGRVATFGNRQQEGGFSKPMSEIVPRWEWRTFGRDFGPAEAVFSELTPIGAATVSEEVYFHHPEVGAIVKIRDGLLDIKVLKEVDSEGLEQWLPVLKEGFPLARELAVTALEFMGVEAAELGRLAYTEPQLIDEVTGRIPDVWPTQITKHRVRYVLDGCMSELSDLVIGTTPVRTIAVESEDREAVLAAVAHLGLGDHLNHNFLRAMTALLDDRTVRYAVVDVGTNSVKFHIGERLADGTWKKVVDRAEVTRLGEGQTEGGPIQEGPMVRTTDAIEGMVEQARDNRVKVLAVVGTAALRTASNRDQVVEFIRKRTGVQVVVISGEEETRLAFLAVKAGLSLEPGSMVVFDTGGGSSQFTFGAADAVIEQFSLPVGAVRYTEVFGLEGEVSTETLARAREAITADLGALDGRARPEAVVGMGGAITNLTAVSLKMGNYDPDRVQGAILERAEVERQIEIYRSTPLESRRSIVGLQPKRAEVILAGACIVATVMEKLGQESLLVSDHGLRHGLLRESFSA